jgi:hypothetical protein
VALAFLFRVPPFKMKDWDAVLLIAVEGSIVEASVSTSTAERGFEEASLTLSVSVRGEASSLLEISTTATVEGF